VYGRRASELVEGLRDIFGDFPAELNTKTPRRNSFECTLIRKDGSEVLVWTGIRKGPPRKLKFPEVATVADAIRVALD